MEISFSKRRGKITKSKKKDKITISIENEGKDTKFPFL